MNRGWSTRSPNRPRSETNASGSLRLPAAFARTRSANWSTISIGSPASSMPSAYRAQLATTAAERAISPPLSSWSRIDGHEPLRDAVRALRAQPGQRVANLAVGEPLDQRLLVLVQVDPGDRLQGRGRLEIHVVEEEPREQRVLCGLVDEPVAGQVAEVAHRLVARVQQPELHQLVRLDVVDQLGTDRLVGGASEREVVLQNPLREGLAHDRPGVGDPEPLRRPPRGRRRSSPA